MNKLHRVFFHELGHFVARELNFRYLKGIGSSEILIYPCKEDESEYCGEIFPKRPEGIEEDDVNTHVPLIRLAGHLANLLYGCIFQSYFLKSDLNICTHHTGNGNDDISDWAAILGHCELGDLNRVISSLSLEHFDFLTTHNSLDPFMKLNPEDYAIEYTVGHFQVDLDNLHSEIDLVIEGHSTIYLEYVRTHQVIIDEELEYLQKMKQRS